MISSEWQSQIFEGGGKKKEKEWWSESGSNGPKSGPKQGFWPFYWVWMVGFPAFSFYFIKGGKILLNMYFVSGDYIEFHI